MNWLSTQMVLVNAASGVVEFALNWLLQSTLLIAVGLLIGGLLRRHGSAVQSVVYRTTLAAVLICPLATWGLSQAGVSGWSVKTPAGWGYEPVDVVAVAEFAENVPLLLDAPSEPLEATPMPAFPAQSFPLVDEAPIPDAMPVDTPSPLAIEMAEEPETSPVAVESMDEEDEELVAATPMEFSIHRFGLAALAVLAVWLIVSLGFTARLAVAWWRTARLRRCSLHADYEIMRECQELASVLGVSVPEVLRSPYLPSPCLVGLFKPVVLLPEGELDLLLRDALIHELAHLRRRDCHWNLLRQMATALFFFQPLLWRLSRRIEATAEEVCDDYVIKYGGNRQEYAHQLVDIAELRTAPIAAAGVGIVSLRSMLAKRVTRIMDTSRALSTRVGNLLLVLVLTGGLIGTTIVGLVGLGPQPLQAEAELIVTDGDTASDTTTSSEEDAKTSAKVSENEDTIVYVHGKILGPDGQPFAGAIVSAIQARTTDRAWTTTQEIVHQTTSAEDGSYSFELPELVGEILGNEQLIRQHYEFFAQAPGLAPDFLPLDTPRRGDSLDLKLGEIGPAIEGRVIDLEGQPVAGVRVTMLTIRPSKEERLVDEWVKKASNNPRVLPADNYMPNNKDGPQVAHFPWFKRLAVEGLSLIPDVVTGADGTFRFAGLSADCHVTMQLEGPAIATGWINAVTRDMKPVPLPSRDPRDAAQVYYGAKFDHLAAPTQIIRGVVRDVDTQQPLAGQLVHVHQFGDSLLGIHGFVSATTDEQGHYELVGLPKPGDDSRPIDLRVIPNSESPYFRTEIEVPKAGGFDAVQCDIALKRGVWLTGQVTDQQTGEPQQARVSYLPFLDNDAAKDYENFNPGIRSIGQDGYYPTTAEGTFRIPAIAGRGVIMAIARDVRRYGIGQGADQIEGLRNDKRLSIYHLWGTEFTNSIREVNVAAGSDETSVAIELVPLKRRVFAIQDSTGEPLSGVSVIGQFPRSSLSQSPHWSKETPLEGNQVSIYGLDHDQQRPVLFLHKDKREAVATILTPTTTGPIQLLPCAMITGRLTNGGSPVSALAYVTAEMNGPVVVQSKSDAGLFMRWSYSPTAQVDAKGYFQIDTVVPGVKYVIRVKGVTRESMLHTMGELGGTEFIQPGETIHLGTIDIASDERPEPVRMKAVGDGLNSELSVKRVPDDEPTVTAVESTTAIIREQDERASVYEGKVLDPTGKPVAGAELYVGSYPPQATGLLVPVSKPVATTDAEGTFRFTGSPQQFGSRATAQEFGNASLVAVKKGFGFAWAPGGIGTYETSGKWLRETQGQLDEVPAEFREQRKQSLRGAGEPLRMTVDDQPIHGRIVDINGQPVTGARLTLLRVWSGSENDLSDWRKATKEPKADFYSTRMKTPMVIGGQQVRSIVAPATTDDNGRFTLHGVGRGRIVQLLLEGPRIESAKIYARTEAGEKIELMRQWSSPDLGTHIYYPAELVYVAGPSTAITGVVRDSQTNAPLAGVTVKSQARHGEQISGWGQDFVRAVTDEQGQYRLEGMPLGSDNRIAALAPIGDIPYLSMSKGAATTSQEGPLEIDFDLKRGVWIEGRIIDAQTGNGLAGRLAYYVKQESASYKFIRSLNVDERFRLQSDDEGNFRIAALPGPGFITFMANDFPHYPRADSIRKLDGSRKKVGRTMLKTGPSTLMPQNWHLVAEIDPAADAKRIILNLQLDGGTSIVGHVVAPDGQPVTGYYYSGRMAQFGSWRPATKDTFELIGYDPKSPRHVYFGHIQRNLAGHVLVKGNSPGGLVVTLQPAGKVTGRLVDEDGAPLANCELHPWYPPVSSPTDMANVRHTPPLPHNVVNSTVGQYETDDEGRFEIAGLAPGVEYRVRAFSRAGMTPARGRMPKVFGQLDVVIKVTPGETKDLGDVKLVDAAKVTAVVKAKPIAVASSSIAKPAEDNAGDSPTSTTVKGKVVGSDGQPVSGATVYVVSTRIEDWLLPSRETVLEKAVVDPSGGFEFTVAMPPRDPRIDGRPNRARYEQVIAVADGYGAAATDAIALRQGEELKLQLSAAAVPIEGQILNLEGEPVVGATLSVAIVRKPRDGLDKQLASLRKRAKEPPEMSWDNSFFLEEDFLKSKIDKNTNEKLQGNKMRFHSVALPSPVTTDQNGRFRIEGIGQDHVVAIQLSGKGIVTSWLSVVTREIEPIKASIFIAARTGMTYGTKFSYIAEPSQPIEGVVTDVDTGEPIEGVRIKAHQHDAGHASSITDASGRYRLVGIPKKDRHDLRIMPSTSEPYFSRMETLEDTAPGLDPTVFNISLKRGLWIEGKVTDRASGEGVNARVWFYPLLDNEHVHDFKAFDANRFADRYSLDFAHTNGDGSFQVRATPGRGVLVAQAVDGRFCIGVGSETIPVKKDRGFFKVYNPLHRKWGHVFKIVDISSKNEPLVVDLQVDPGATLSVRLQDETGQPLVDVRVKGRQPTSHGMDVPLDKSSVEIQGIDSKRPRAVFFYHAERNLGAFVLANQERSGNQTVKLLPCGTLQGRLLDKDGKPAVDVRLGIKPAALIDLDRPFPIAKTDQDGRFETKHFIPTAKFNLYATSSNNPQEIADTIELQPGQTLDLGDVKLAAATKSTTATEETKKTLSTVQAKQQTVVSGQITSADGKPVTGAYVAIVAWQIRPARGGNLTPFGKALAEGVTNENGQYRLALEGVNSKTHRNAKVIARKDGTAVAWQDLNLDATNTEASLELPPDDPIRGRLVDIEGQPAAGVRLVVQVVLKRTADGTWSRDSAGYHGGEPVPAAWLSTIIADDQGRFTVHGVPAGYGVFLKVVGGDRFAPQSISLNTGMPEQRGKQDGTYRSLVKNVEAGEEAILPLAPAQLFEGVVTYEDTEEPAPHARLSIWASQQEQYGSMISVAGTADAEGRYRISPNPGVRFGVTAYAPDGTPYLARKTPFDDAIRWRAGDRVRQVDMTLPRGVLVRGKIVEAETGEPIAGASIQYLRGSDNPDTSDDILTGWQAIQVSNEQGEYEIAVLPGPGRLLVHGPRNEYVIQQTTSNQLSRGRPGGERRYAHHIQKIDATADRVPLEMSFTLHRGGSVHGTLVDETGEAVDEALMISWRNIHATNLGWRGHSPTVLGGHFDVGGLVEGEEYPVFFLDAKRRLGATVMIRADEPSPRVVLKPCGSAVMRFVDDAGKPVANQRTGDVYMVARPGAHRDNRLVMMAGGEAADSDFIQNVDRINNPKLEDTDEEGRLRLPVLIPGATYRIITRRGRGNMWSTPKDFVAEAGTTTDLGDIVVEAGEE